MTRIVKSFLTFTAVLAMCSAAAPGVQAEFSAQITSEQSPWTIDGKQIGETVITRLGRTVKCKTANLHTEGINGSTTVTVTPEYKECTSSLGPMTVTMNGCHYLWHLTANVEDTMTAVVTLVCPGTNKAEYEIYTSAANHASGTTACKYKFGSQTFGGTIDFTNEPAGGITPKDWIKAHVNLANITSTSEGSILLCGAANDGTGTLAGELEMKGTNQLKEPTGLTVSTNF